MLVELIKPGGLVTHLCLQDGTCISRTDLPVHSVANMHDCKGTHKGFLRTYIKYSFFQNLLMIAAVPSVLPIHYPLSTILYQSHQ